MYGFAPLQKPLLQASYQVAYQIAKSKKPYTISKKLIKPSVLKKADIVLGKEAAKKLQQVSLCNDIIHNRIVDMSEDILEQVVAEIKASSVKISLQVNESTDVLNCCQLIIVVRYVKSKEVEESFLLSITENCIASQRRISCDKKFYQYTPTSPRQNWFNIH